MTKSSSNSSNLDNLLLHDQDNNNFVNRLRSKKELIFKVLVIGDFGVGKTSIIKRYADGTFSSSYRITIGADFAIKAVNFDDQTRINLHLWDIAGHERFGALTGVYYRHAVAAIIVFDLTRPETFKSVEKWLLDLRKKVHLPGDMRIPVIVLANKGDITIASIPDEIVHFCTKYDILGWFITSAKENINIDKAMDFLIIAALNNHNNLQFNQTQDEEDTATVKLMESNNTQGTGDKKISYCCQTIIT